MRNIILIHISTNYQQQHHRYMNSRLCSFVWRIRALSLSLTKNLLTDYKIMFVCVCLILMNKEWSNPHTYTQLLTLLSISALRRTEHVLIVDFHSLHLRDYVVIAQKKKEKKYRNNIMRCSKWTKKVCIVVGIGYGKVRNAELMPQ